MLIIFILFYRYGRHLTDYHSHRYFHISSYSPRLSVFVYLLNFMKIEFKLFMHFKFRIPQASYPLHSHCMLVTPYIPENLDRSHHYYYWDGQRNLWDGQTKRMKTICLPQKGRRHNNYLTSITFFMQTQPLVQKVLNLYRNYCNPIHSMMWFSPNTVLIMRTGLSWAGESVLIVRTGLSWAGESVLIMRTGLSWAGESAQDSPVLTISTDSHKIR
jgi:hypothetical protein